jgi:arsenate reductase
MSSDAALRRKPRIVFVGATNANRTQMAEGYMRKVGHDVFEVRSAGMQMGRIDPETLEVMAGDQIDIKMQQPTVLTPDLLAWADLVIVIAGLGETVDPKVPDSARMKFWPVDRPDTSGDAQTRREAYKAARDQIKRRVTQLVTSVRLFRG